MLVYLKYSLCNFSDTILPEVSKAMESSRNNLPVLEGFSSDISTTEGRLYVCGCICAHFVCNKLALCPHVIMSVYDSH